MGLDDVKMGACQVIWGTDGVDAVTFGYTDEGAKNKVELTLEDVKVHELGDTPIDKRVKAVVVTVGLTLVEWSNADLKRALADMPTVSGSKLTIAAAIGASLYAKAKPLRLHPRALDPADKSEDVYYYKAVAVGPVETDFRVVEKRKIPLNFVVFPERSRLAAGQDYWGYVGA